MTYTYYSSAKCTIRINNSIASEVVSLQFSEQEQILPIYGWNDPFFHTIGAGNILITGTIIFNARYPNYLERLITGKLLTSEAQSANKTALTAIQTQLNDLTKEVGTATTNSGIAFYEDRVVSDIVALARLNEQYNGDENVIQNPSIKGYPERTNNTFSIAIQGPSSTDIIEMCRLSSRASEINAGEANNIKSAQSFIGRKLSQNALLNK